MIVALILLGRFLEAGRRARASETIKRLVGLQARVAACVTRRAASWISLSTRLCWATVEVRRGERIPVDGEVTEGHSFVDES